MLRTINTLARLESQMSDQHSLMSLLCTSCGKCKAPAEFVDSQALVRLKPTGLGLDEAQVHRTCIMCGIFDSRCRYRKRATIMVQGHRKVVCWCCGLVVPEEDAVIIHCRGHRRRKVGVQKYCQGCTKRHGFWYETIAGGIGYEQVSLRQWMGNRARSSWDGVVNMVWWIKGLFV